MKKLITILLSIVLVATLGLTVACQSHNWAKDWSSDKDNHWHKCLDEGCEEISDKAPHVDENNDKVCDVCKYNMGGTVNPQPTKYALTYAAGEGSGTAPATEQVAEGAEVTLKANMFTAPEGKEFDGWLVDGVKKAAGDKVTMPAKALTITAQWKETQQPEPPQPETVTVTFKNGDDTVKTVTLNKGDALTSDDMPADPQVEEGKEFKGWFDGETEIKVGTVINAAIIATAKIETTTVTPPQPETVTVTFKNGDDTVKTVTLNKGDALTSDDMPADPEVEEGKEFKGWFDGETEIKVGTVINADVIATAKIESTTVTPPQPETVTVTFKNGDDTVKTVTLNKGDALTAEDMPAAPEVGANEAFKGWFDGETEIKVGAVINADVTATAKIESITTLTGITATYDGTIVVGDGLDSTKLTVTATYSDESSKAVVGTADAIDTTTAGDKQVTITYTENDVTKTCTVTITVVEYTITLKVGDEAQAAPTENEGVYTWTLTLNRGDIVTIADNRFGDLQISGKAQYTVIRTGTHTITATPGATSTAINVTLPELVVTLTVTRGGEVVDTLTRDTLENGEYPFKAVELKADDVVTITDNEGNTHSIYGNYSAAEWDKANSKATKDGNYDFYVKTNEVHVGYTDTSKKVTIVVNDGTPVELTLTEAGDEYVIRKVELNVGDKVKILDGGTAYTSWKNGIAIKAKAGDTEAEVETAGKYDFYVKFTGDVGIWVAKSPEEKGVTISVNGGAEQELTVNDSGDEYSIKGLMLNVGDTVVIKVDGEVYTNWKSGCGFTGTALETGNHDFYVKLANGDLGIWVTRP